MANILIIDDDEMICETLVDVVTDLGHDARYALRLKDGLNMVSKDVFDMVFLDVRLPDGNGLKALPGIREASSSPDVIIITGEGDPDGAELAIKSGAWDYIQKPLSVETITLPILRVLQYREERGTKRSTVVLKREGIIGNSQQMRRCLDLMAQAANNDANVLINGETGTGKEIFARAIHDNSPRADKEFVIVDCTVLPETLVESILFGHKKGAFTGADKAQEGLIRQANGGTLFLDEIGELPMNVQKAFLRVLQEHRFRPVGGKKEIESDFRLIAATNRDLDKMVQAGEFRSDLMFRLKSIIIDLPPLRGRRKDIKDLVIHYLSAYCDRYGIVTKGFSPEFYEALMAYNWPGNVRELINALDGSLSSARDEHALFPIHLPTQIRTQLARASVESQPSYNDSSDSGPKIYKTPPNLRVLLETTERQYLQDLMSFTEGKVKVACGISGLSRSRLYDRLKKYDLPKK